MNISKLLNISNQAFDDISYTGLAVDSRHVKPGDIFFAYPGHGTDGRHYLFQAEAVGATAIVYDDSSYQLEMGHSIPCIAISDLSRQIGAIAARFYQSPSEHLDVVGITGTNGKTTIAYQLAGACESLGTSSAYIGTLGQGGVEQLQALENTTPGALDLQNYLASYVKENISNVYMEVSSHALQQSRVEAVNFSQAIYTNLSHDHLDYHKNMQDYARAKAMLFDRPELQYAIINTDDHWHKTMLRAVSSQAKILTYGIEQPADIQLLSADIAMGGSQLSIKSPWGKAQFKINSLGRFNLYNSLAVFASLMASGFKLEDVCRQMSSMNAAPGRMEIIVTDPVVIVDFAHTPDALENVLKTLNSVKKGKLWVVFGCGGDRDSQKRPIMGEIASRYADEVMITSDNPRHENPQQIIDDIAKGISSTKPHQQKVMREDAILSVLSRVGPDDIVLIAGKGHEEYQQIGVIKYPFSDQKIVRDWSQSLRNES